MKGIPDVVSDSVTDAAKRLELPMTRFFLVAASHARRGQGFSNNPQVAERWQGIWMRCGVASLPPACKDFVLEVLNGEFTKAQLHQGA